MKAQRRLDAPVDSSSQVPSGPAGAATPAARPAATDAYDGPRSAWAQAAAVMTALEALSAEPGGATGKLFVKFGRYGRSFPPSRQILHELRAGKAFGLHTFHSPGWANRLINLGMISSEPRSVDSRRIWEIRGPEDLVEYWKAAGPYLAPDQFPLPGEPDPVLGGRAE